MVETDKDDDDEDDDHEEEDDEDQDEDEEDDYMPHISWETVDGYLVGISGHLEHYPWLAYRDTGLSDEAI